MAVVIVHKADYEQANYGNNDTYKDTEKERSFIHCCAFNVSTQSYKELAICGKFVEEKLCVGRRNMRFLCNFAVEINIVLNIF